MLCEPVQPCPSTTVRTGGGIRLHATAKKACKVATTRMRHAGHLGNADGQAVSSASRANIANGAMTTRGKDNLKGAAICVGTLGAFACNDGLIKLVM